MTVEVVGQDESSALPPELQDDVFLLALEAVRNAVKHSHASRITVELARALDDPTALRVVVTDDGDGFVTSRRSASAVGLDAMRERAQAHGGSLTLTTEPDHGTTVTSVFPGVYSVGSAIAADARVEDIS